MQGKIIWQQSSTKPENPNNLALISQWWRSLADQKVTFAQRMIPQSGKVDEYSLNWLYCFDILNINAIAYTRRQLLHHAAKLVT